MKQTISFFESLSEKEISALIEIGKLFHSTFLNYFFELTESNFAIYKKDNLQVALFCFSMYKGKRMFLYRKEAKANAQVYYYDGDPFEHLDDVMNIVYKQILNNYQNNQQHELKKHSNKKNKEEFLQRICDCLSDDESKLKAHYEHENQIANVFMFFMQETKEDKNNYKI